MRGHVVVLCLLALAAAGCSTNTVDSSKVEQGIKDDLSESANVAGAKCPDDVKRENGATFTCDVKFESGATGKAEVTQTGSKTFTYELQDGSVRLPGSAAAAQIESALGQQGVEDAAVHCPETIAVKLRTAVTCDVAGATTGKVVFAFSSQDGTIDPSSVKTS
jgi:ferredoxin